MKSPRSRATDPATGRQRKTPSVLAPCRWLQNAPYPAAPSAVRKRIKLPKQTALVRRSANCVSLERVLTFEQLEEQEEFDVGQQ